MSKLSLKTAPTVPVVTTADMKSYLKVDTLITEDDTLIASLVKAATSKIEKLARIALITQTFEYYLDAIGNKIELPRPPLQSVTTFQYYDESYTVYTMPASLYVVKAFAIADPGFILRLKYESWPVYTDGGCGILITYKAGYGDASTSVPDDLITALKMIVAHWYDNRESQEIPPEAMTIIESYKIFFPPGGD